METQTIQTTWNLLTELIPTTFDHLQKGGEVMIPMTIVSVFIWLLIFQIGWRLLLVGKEQPLNSCLESAYRGNFIGCSWQRQFLEAFFKRRSRVSAIDHKLMESLVLAFRNQTQRYINSVLMLAAIAPLLGLLGTVMGMVTTFDTIGQFGTGNARALASGISEALITTQTGLIIAVPGLLVGTMLKRETDKLTERIRHFGLKVVNQLDLQQPIAGSLATQAVGRSR